jgi:hypothetical protein
MPSRVNIITRILQETITLPVSDSPSALSTLLALTGQVICQSVFLYSPLNDGIYTSNTLPILVGSGNIVLESTGQPLLPGEWLYYDIDSTEKIYVYEPSGAGTQLLIITVSG